MKEITVVKEPEVMTRVFVYREPINMSKSFRGLVALVNDWKGTPDAASGDMFVFLNRKRTYVKILFWSKGGMCILAKKLEGGAFHIELGKKRISVTELSQALELKPDE